jgi:hypothetical protein
MSVRWTISDSRRDEPRPGSLSQPAETGFVEITNGTETRRIKIDLSGPAAASGLTFNPRGGVYFNLEDAVRDDLDLVDPPTHLIVTPLGVELAE